MKGLHSGIAQTKQRRPRMKRTNYKQEKRLKELEKQRKKEAKKERKLQKEQVLSEPDPAKPEEESI